MRWVRVESFTDPMDATCVASAPEQFAQFVKKEQVKWGDIDRKSGAKIDKSCSADLLDRQ